MYYAPRPTPLKNKGLVGAEYRGRWTPVFASPAEGFLWYNSPMNYTSPDKPGPESIAARLARSEAQIAAGQTVPLQPVLDRLRSSIDRMKACR
jgi:hypothetical protein